MALLSNLYSKEQFNTPENLILNANIYEYDIVKCNVSVLRAYGEITEQEYRNFCEMPKMIREKAIGDRERMENSSLGYSPTHKLIQAGKIEAKEKLFDMNHITNEMIIRIASDAVMVNTLSPFTYTVVPIGNGYGTVEFKQNGPWHNYVRLFSVMVFFQKLPNAQLISLMEIDKNSALRFFKEYYDRYVNMDLPINNYREFNSGSSFRVNKSGYGAIFLDDAYKEKIDINYNLGILRDLYRMILKLPS